MGKRFSKFVAIILTLFFTLGNTLSITALAEEELKTNKINEIKITNSISGESALIAMYSGGKLKTCSFKISVPKGTLVLYMFDRASFKVEVINK